MSNQLTKQKEEFSLLTRRFYSQGSWPLHRSWFYYRLLGGSIVGLFWLKWVVQSVANTLEELLVRSSEQSEIALLEVLGNDAFPDSLREITSVGLDESQWDCARKYKLLDVISQGNQLETEVLFECQHYGKLQVSGESLRQEDQMKQSIKESFLQIAKNVTTNAVQLDDIVESLFCRILRKE